MWWMWLNSVVPKCLDDSSGVSSSADGCPRNKLASCSRSDACFKSCACDPGHLSSQNLALPSMLRDACFKSCTCDPGHSSSENLAIHAAQQSLDIETCLKPPTCSLSSSATRRVFPAPSLPTTASVQSGVSLLRGCCRTASCKQGRFGVGAVSIIAGSARVFGAKRACLLLRKRGSGICF